jgi:hypothetical protein
MKITERVSLEARLERKANTQYRAQQERARFNDKIVSVEEDDLDDQNDLVLQAYQMLKVR